MDQGQKVTSNPCEVCHEWARNDLDCRDCPQAKTFVEMIDELLESEEEN